jgi:hypothetical protein
MRYHEIMSEAATSSPAFLNWFSGSKVVDRQGKPLRVYHGTRKDFENFDLALAGMVGDHFAEAAFFTDDPQIASGYAVSWMNNDDFVKAREAEDQAGKAMFSAALEFGPNSNQTIRAQQEHKRLGDIRAKIGDAIDSFQSPSTGANVRPVYLSIKHPLVVNAKGLHFRQTHKDAFERAVEGHDGVIIRDVFDSATTFSKRASTVFAVFHLSQIKSAFS